MRYLITDEDLTVVVGELVITDETVELKMYRTAEPTEQEEEKE